MTIVAPEHLLVKNFFCTLASVVILVGVVEASSLGKARHFIPASVEHVLCTYVTCCTRVISFQKDMHLP